MTAVLCMGAPLSSSTLIAGMAALRLQRVRRCRGAVVPGWQAIESWAALIPLGSPRTCLPPTAWCWRISASFKGGRIDRAILYAASVLEPERRYPAGAVPSDH